MGDTACRVRRVLETGELLDGVELSTASLAAAWSACGSSAPATTLCAGAARSSPACLYVRTLLERRRVEARATRAPPERAVREGSCARRRRRCARDEFLSAAAYERARRSLCYAAAPATLLRQVAGGHLC